MLDRYLAALSQIPPGETRSFMELAAMAGRPGAARAAGRAIRACPLDSELPWQRVVSADGALVGEASREALQIARLREEGARPREGESVADWCRRCSIGFVGKLPGRVFLPAGDPRVGRWSARRVEPLSDEDAALARGFRPPGGHVEKPLGVARRARIGPAATGAPDALDARLDAVDWNGARASLSSVGCHNLPGLLSAAECDAIVAASEEADRFDRGVDMLAKGYGVGRYRYWKEPLPAPLGSLRERLYRELRSALTELPPTLDAFWSHCREAGQRRPSSILIQYPTRGVNHPHRDIYGKVSFPFQALVMLSRAGSDFEGGEFLLEEEHPEGDRRREVPVTEGDVLLFCTRERREGEGRGRAVPLRHGMLPVTRGEREAVGMVFHLAE